MQSNPKHNQSLGYWLAFFTIIVLPNIFISDDRETGVLRSAIVIVFTLAYSISKRTRIIQNIHPLIYVFLGSCIIASATSSYYLTGLFGLYGSPLGTLSFVSALTCGYLLARFEDVARIRGMIITSGFVSGLIAIAIAIPQIHLNGLRLAGFYEHSLAFAIFIGVAGILYIDTLLRERESLSWPSVSGLLFLYMCVAFSGSRAAFLSFTIILVIYCNSQLRDKKILWSIASLFLLSMLFTSRFRDIGYLAESVSYRFALMKRGVEIFMEHPLGIGLGNYGAYSYDLNLPSYLLELYHRGIFLESSHNFWIDNFVGFGIIGGLIILIITLHTIRRSFRAITRLDPYTLSYIFICINLLVTPISITTTILLGIMLGILYRVKANS